jgi:hypothetical protein
MEVQSCPASRPLTCGALATEGSPGVGAGWVRGAGLGVLAGAELVAPPAAGVVGGDVAWPGDGDGDGVPLPHAAMATTIIVVAAACAARHILIA